MGIPDDIFQDCRFQHIQRRVVVDEKNKRPFLFCGECKGVRSPVNAL